MITNKTDLPMFYNTYDTSLYIIPPSIKSLYVKGGLPEVESYALTDGKFNDYSLCDEEQLLNSVYFNIRYINPSVSYVLAEGSIISIDLINDIFEEVDFNIFIRINITDVDNPIWIQPSYISTNNGRMNIKIIDLLNLSSLSIDSIDILKAEYIYPISVSENEVSVNLNYEYLYKITNSSYNNNIIMNSYGIPLDKTNIYLDKDNLDYNIVSNDYGIIDRTINRGYFEITSDLTILHKANHLKYKISSKAPSGIIVSKNDKPLTSAENKLKNKYVYYSYPISYPEACFGVYQFDIRDDYYSDYEKEQIQQYNYNELCSQIQISSTYGKQYDKSKTGVPLFFLHSEEYEVSLDLTHSNYTFGNLPYKIMLIEDNYYLSDI